METLNMTTPALSFSALLLILLAYTNRFMGNAQIIRNLYPEYTKTKDYILIDQIKSLRKRLHLIKAMQILGVLSLLISVASMLPLCMSLSTLGTYIFALGLIAMIAISIHFNMGNTNIGKSS